MQVLAKRIITGIILIASFIVSFFYLPPCILSTLLALALLTILVFEWPRIFAVNSLAFWLISPFYPILPLVVLIVLNQSEHSRFLVFAIITLTALYDTGAYVAGKIFGTHKIAPSISPQKTWEGLLGGYILTLLGVLIMSHYNLINISFALALPFAALVCGAAFFGDLFESWLKRSAHIKDSGTLLPGHGGLLDRFDGILAVTCVLYVLKNYLIVIK